MLTKALFGAIGVALMALFLGPIVLKLKEPALAVVVLIGLGLMVLDYIQSLREGD